MHIAICDDNIADRKQLERLLARESDRRIKTTGNLYIDSFGSIHALMHAPMLYDLFFIDYHSEGYGGADVAGQLRHTGVSAPIVLCSGTTDYTTCTNLPDNILHINKPIQVQELTDIVSMGIEIHVNSKPSIPIQGEKETFYLQEDHILYAEQKKHMLYIHATTGETFSTLGKLSDLIVTLENNPHFLPLNKICLINLCHVSQIRTGSMLLDNHKKIVFPFWKTRKTILYWRYALSKN